jgi:hypothetical protein
MSAHVAQIRPLWMSAIRLLSGVKRTLLRLPKQLRGLIRRLRNRGRGLLWQIGAREGTHCDPQRAMRLCRHACTRDRSRAADVGCHAPPRAVRMPRSLSSGGDSVQAAKALGPQIIHDGPQVRRAMLCVRLDTGNCPLVTTCLPPRPFAFASRVLAAVT